MSFAERFWSATGKRYEEFGPTFASEKPAGEQPMTAFGKTCKKLGIEIIKARSPQAKGRVERFEAQLRSTSFSINRFCSAVIRS
jgi:hypothetical protein